MHFLAKTSPSKYLILCLFMQIGVYIYAQKHELGLSFGGVNSTGDINLRFNFKNYRLAAQLVHRYNISKSLCSRLSVLFGQIYGNEKKSKFIVPTVRQGSFRGTITEMGFMLEYNFTNYRDKKTPYKYCPFFCTGFALYTTSTEVSSNSIAENHDDDFLKTSLPIGIGIKHTLNKRLNLQLEFVARKCFNDFLDGISKGMIGQQISSNPLDTDWYFYTGAGISYTFYKLKCPQPQNF